jgi:hypothetical protein
MLEQLSLLTWLSTDFVGINWRNWGVLLVGMTAFLCKLANKSSNKLHEDIKINSN